MLGRKARTHPRRDNKIVSFEKLSAAFDRINKLSNARFKFQIDEETGIIYVKCDDFIYFVSKFYYWFMRYLTRHKISTVSLKSRLHNNRLVINDAVYLSFTCTEHKCRSIYGKVIRCKNFITKIINGKIYCNANYTTVFKLNGQFIGYDNINGVFGIIHGIEVTDPIPPKYKLFIPQKIELNECNQLFIQSHNLCCDYHHLEQSNPFLSFTFNRDKDYCLEILYTTGKTVKYRILLYVGRVFMGDRNNELTEFTIHEYNDTNPDKDRLIYNKFGTLTKKDDNLKKIFVIIRNKKFYLNAFYDGYDSMYGDFDIYSDIHGNLCCIHYEYNLYGVKSTYMAAYVDSKGNNIKSVKNEI